MKKLSYLKNIETLLNFYAHRIKETRIFKREKINDKLQKMIL